jgi:hypothetical protein
LDAVHFNVCSCGIFVERAITRGYASYVVVVDDDDDDNNNNRHCTPIFGKW